MIHHDPCVMIITTRRFECDHASHRIGKPSLLPCQISAFRRCVIALSKRAHARCCLARHASGACTSRLFIISMQSSTLCGVPIKLRAVRFASSALITRAASFAQRPPNERCQNDPVHTTPLIYNRPSVWILLRRIDVRVDQTFIDCIAPPAALPLGKCLAHRNGCRDDPDAVSVRDVLPQRRRVAEVIDLLVPQIDCRLLERSAPIDARASTSDASLSSRLCAALTTYGRSLRACSM